VHVKPERDISYLTVCIVLPAAWLCIYGGIRIAGKDKSMKVLLLRHGMTAGNTEKRYIGRTDEPLCPQGEKMARESGAFPNVEKVYISPMARARQTAAILFPNVRQEEVYDLREMDFGDFEGRSPDEMENDPVYREWVDNMCLGQCPGGESLEGFKDRVCDAFLEVVRSARKSGEDRIIIVSHGGTIMSIMDRYAVPKREYYAWMTENCRGWRADLEICGEDIALADYEYMKTLDI